MCCLVVFDYRNPSTHTLHTQESTKRRAKRKATDNGEEEKPQPVLASVCVVGALVATLHGSTLWCA